jgi:DNA uptake protein ComE-like DNA-binding protein
MKEWLFSWITWHSRQRKILVLLAGFNLLLFFTWFFLMWQQGPAEKTEDPLLVTFSLYKINDQKQREGNSEVRGFEKENKPAFFTHKKTKSPKQIHKIDLNRADSVMLLSLKGIGPVFAGRIIKYRQRLRGFYSPQQLLEVYGFDSLRLQNILPYIFADPEKIQVWDLNRVNEDSLKYHHYISRNLRKVIPNYRLFHGNFTSVEDLKKIDLVDAKLYSKIAPYFRVYGKEGKSDQEQHQERHP